MNTTKTNRMFRHTETMGILSLSQLENSFENMKADGETESKIFSDFISNCLANGIIKEIQMGEKEILVHKISELMDSIAILGNNMKLSGKKTHYVTYIGKIKELKECLDELQGGVE